MTSFTIEVQDKEVRALLTKLAGRAGGLRPVLAVIGEGIMERAKRRFESSTGPDGVKWKDNSPATLAMLRERLSGQKSKVKKDGSLNAAGQRAYANKKPLIEGGDLSRQFTIAASGDTVTVGNTMVYAAIHQFGGKTSPHTIVPKHKKALAFGGNVVKKVNHPGSKIPARPFLPIRADGTMYPADQAEVIAALNHFLLEGL